MAQRFVSFSLVARTRPGFGEAASGNPCNTRRTFFDFVVEGVSLYELAAESRDRISVIPAEPPAPTEQIRR